MPSAKERVVDFFGSFKEHRAWALVIALVNLVGIAYGFYYYGEQFATTPAWLWWLVPDSPLAVLWAQLALVAFWLLPASVRARPLDASNSTGQRMLARAGSAFSALAFVGNVQVGLWTCYVLLAYEGHFHTLDFLQGEGPIALNSVLWVGHLGMVALALIYVKGLRDARHAPASASGSSTAQPAAPAWWAVGLAAAYYLLNDVVDYFGPDFRGVGCGMRPHTVPCLTSSSGGALSPEMTLALVTFGLTFASVAALALLMRRRS